MCAALAAEEVTHSCARACSARSGRNIATASSAMSALPSLSYAPFSPRKGQQHAERTRSICFNMSEIGLDDPSGNPDSNESTAWANQGGSVEGDFSKGTTLNDAVAPQSLSKAENVYVKSTTNAGSANNKLESSGCYTPRSVNHRPESKTQSVLSCSDGFDCMSRLVPKQESSRVTWFPSNSSYRYTSRAGSEAHYFEHEQRLGSKLEAIAQDSHGSVDLQGKQHVVSEAATWDRLSIRKWFNSIDTDKDGIISKQEWFNFVRQHPKFRQMMLNLTGEWVVDRLALTNMQRVRAEAMEMKQVMKVFRDLDLDSSGTLDFEEFLEFFRRTGHLIQYKGEANPREEMASILGDIHHNKEAVGNSTVHRLLSLAQHNLTSKQSRAIERNVLRLRFRS